MKHLLILTLLVGCGADLYENPSDHRRTVVTEGEHQNVQPGAVTQSNYGDYGIYVEEFKLLVQQYTGTYPEDKITDISYREESRPNVLATCVSSVRVVGGKDQVVTAKIEIDPNMKDKSEILFRTVIFHELGHCIMASNHSKTRQDLMYPYSQEKITKQGSDAIIKFYMERLAKGEI